MSAVRSQMRVSATTLPELVVQLNDLLSRLQGGGMALLGLRLDTLATAAPTAAPQPGDPLVRAATIAGTLTYYHWDGTSWTTF